MSSPKAVFGTEGGNSSSAALSQRLADLPAEKRLLLRKLLAKKANEPIPNRDPREPVPLTYSQRRLWIIEQLVAGGPAYNEVNSIRLRQALNLSALRAAFQEIIRRHEILRTVVALDDDNPMQRVRPTLTIDIPLIDLRQAPAAQREQEASRQAAEQSRVPIDLSAGPLLRACLFRLGEDDFLLAVTMHHIICDGWSMGVFAMELSILYWSFAAGRPSPLPELPLQFGDFAVWQAKSVGDHILGPQLAYWRAQLEGLPVLELPLDRPRPVEFTYRGARVQIVLPAKLIDELSELSDRQNVTLHTLMFAALFVLLHRYSGQTDFALGSPIVGRNRKELESLIGFFVNTLVIRPNLAGNPEFSDLLARLHQICFAAYSNQDVPFERLVEELHIPRDPSHNPLVQVVFQVFQVPGTEGLDPALIFGFSPVESGISKFDLAFQLIRSPSGLRGHVEYNIDLFDADRIERLVAHYTKLLESIVRNPSSGIDSLEIMDAEEKRRILVGWNGAASEYERDSTLPVIFQAQVAARPAEPAVEFESRILSYRELDLLSTRGAHRLEAAGVRPGDRVGILLNRSLEVPAAMLAVLKAGAAMVPLDPAFPIDRLNFLIQDSSLKAIIISESERTLVPAAMNLLRIEEWEALPDSPSLSFTTFRATDGACVLYTSGTTGNPKGVELTHRNLVRLVRGASYIKFGPGDVGLHFAPLSFDASTFEIWGCLLNGAKLVIHPPELPAEDELASFIQRSGITVLFLTTSLLRNLLENHAAELRNVRQILTGGEPMPLSLAHALWRELPRTRVVNGYGPTECGTLATAWPIQSPDATGNAAPIGRPLENSTIYILDQNGEPVPTGIPGEIFIGGDGVAPGYLNRSDLTAQAFVPDRFASERGRNLYRTGDRGCYRADGNILFLGRCDRQVKLSGHRIEPGEIEAALLAHPACSAAAVTLIDRQEGPRLAAFVENGHDSAEPVSSETLRQWLALRLPGYMVPGHIEIVPRLPLTRSGKVDFRALEQQTRSPSGSARKCIAPRNELEETLSSIWKEILGVESLSVTDDFFQLGGQSLVATRLLSQIRKTLACSVTMRQFFDHPTVEGLAAVISENAPTRPAGFSLATGAAAPPGFQLAPERFV